MPSLSVTIAAAALAVASLAGPVEARSRRTYTPGKRIDAPGITNVHVIQHSQ